LFLSVFILMGSPQLAKPNMPDTSWWP